MEGNRLRSRPRTALAGVLIVLGSVITPTLSVLPAQAATTSTFTIWSALNFSGTSRTIEGCGVHNLPFAVKSYLWHGNGQSGRMYNVKNAAGAAQFVFPTTGTESSPGADGWESIDIVC